MDEFLKSFKAWLYDKSSNPLFFIFFLCWLAWNYKLLIVAMSSGDAGDKLDLINNLIYPTPSAKWCLMLLYPAATAGITVIAYPLFSNLSAIIFKFYGNLFAKILIELDNKTPVDKDTVNLIRAELIATQEKKNEIETSKNIEIENLRKIIASLQSKVPSEKKLYPDMGLSEIEKKIIGFMGEAFDLDKKHFSDNEFTQFIREKLDVTATVADVAISKLKDNELIKRSGNSYNGYHTYLTDRGKELAVAFNSAKPQKNLPQ